MQSYGKMDSSANNSNVLLYDNMVNNVRSRLYSSLTISNHCLSPPQKKTLNVTYSIYIAYLCLLLAFLYEIGK